LVAVQSLNERAGASRTLPPVNLAIELLARGDDRRWIIFAQALAWFLLLALCDQTA